MYPRLITIGDLDTALVAASKVLDEKQFVVVGSTSILASIENGRLPDAFPPTLDIDLYPVSDSTGEKTEAVKDALGEDTEFFAEHGFYVEVVGKWTMLSALKDWESRLVKIRVGDVTGFCLSPLDAAFNKVEAGRDKDKEYLVQMVRYGLVDVGRLDYEIHALDREQSWKEKLLSVWEEVKSQGIVLREKDKAEKFSITDKNIRSQGRE